MDVRPRVVHQFKFPAELSDRLHDLSREPGASMTRIVVDAVTEYLEKDASSFDGVRHFLRLDRITRGQGRIEKRLVFLVEALGVFIQHQLTMAAHEPPFELETAKLGRLRYEAFLDLVSARVARLHTSGSQDSLRTMDRDAPGSEPAGQTAGTNGAATPPPKKEPDD